MAHGVVNLTYIGAGPTGSGQTIADQTSGPKAKTLYAYGTLVNGSSTFCTETQATINFIDGVQSLGRTIVQSFQAVAAPVTLNGTANQALYSTVGSATQFAVGQSITFAGFTNSANNVTATINSIVTGGIYITNSSAVAETNPAGTGAVVIAPIPVFVDVFYAGQSGDSAAAATIMATGVVAAQSVLGTSFTLAHPSLVTTGATVSIGAILAFSS